MSKEGIAEILASEGSDLSELRKYEGYRWFVEYDGATVGSVGLKNISHTMGYAEIGYGIGDSRQLELWFCDNCKLAAYEGET